MSEPQPAQAASLAGRRALVLGAGTAAGRAAALAMAVAGADVAVAAGSIDGDEVMAVRRVKRAVEALGRRSAEYAMDLTLGANIRVSVRQVAKEMGGLDVLVNAPDAYLRKPADQLSDADWSRILNVNLNGVFYACRAGLKEMAAGGGHIINICSVFGERGAAESAAYVAAKHGVVGLTRALALEYAGRGITVNAVALGRLVGADMALFPEGTPYTDLASLGPLIVSLCSPSGAGVNGQIINVEDSA
ncbi:MAG: SDR family NAD(P)-dependent oxidoreductase [Dehalococcoidia bacterium]